MEIKEIPEIFIDDFETMKDRDSFDELVTKVKQLISLNKDKQ